MAKDTKTYQRDSTLAYWGGIRPLVRRLGRPEMIERNRDGIAAELLSIGYAAVTDVLTWDENGKVKVRASRDIPPAAVKAIKKVKVTTVTDKDGGETHTLELEMWDKVSALRVLSRAAGLLDAPEDDSDKPSVIGINLKGPEPVVEYKEVQEDGNEDDET